MKIKGSKPWDTKHGVAQYFRLTVDIFLYWISICVWFVFIWKKKNNCIIYLYIHKRRLFSLCPYNSATLIIERSNRILWTDDFPIPSMSTTSRTVKRRCSRMTSITRFMSWSSFFVGLPCTSSIGLPFQTSLNLLCQVYTNVCVLQLFSFSSNRCQTSLNTLLNNNSVLRIIVRHFEKFLYA